MTSIFLSWSADDQGPVFRLRDRLRDLGLDVWEYTGDMPAAAQIHDSVIDAINQARTAIICFSDATAEREWIAREADWCYKTIHDGQHALKYMVPVWIAAHPANKTPQIVSEKSLRVWDLAGVTDARLQEFVEHVVAQLGQEAPCVVPAALFAMTRGQCEALFVDNPPGVALADVCLAVGMQAPPDLFADLLERYGDRPEDLSPFQSTEPLMTIVDGVVRKVNAVREAAGRRPLFLRWMQDELVGPPGTRRQQARELWRAGDSLLVVDSVSTFHPDIQARLAQLPEPFDPARAAVLWIPPYTRHTVGLETSLARTVEIVPRIDDAFSDWQQEPGRSVIFDATTSVSIRLWLHRAFTAVPDAPPPRPDNLRAMRAVGGPAAGIRTMMQASGTAAP
jgi:hypothetical protein